jgi:hypothetical protein
MVLSGVAFYEVGTSEIRKIEADRQAPESAHEKGPRGPGETNCEKEA